LQDKVSCHIEKHGCVPKSPPEKVSQFQGKVKNPSTVSISSSLARPATTNLSLSKKSSPKRWVRSFSPPRVAARLLASRLAARFVSALKSKKNASQSGGIVNGVNQRPAATVKFPPPKI